LIDYYGKMLTPKQLNILDLYYNNDLSLSEISENEGITRQGVRDAIKRAETQLRAFESSLGLVENYGRLSELLGQIKREAVEILEYNLRYSCSKEINERCGKIIAQVDTALKI